MRKVLLAMLILLPLAFPLGPSFGAIDTYAGEVTPEPQVSAYGRFVTYRIPFLNPEDVCPSCSIFTTQPFMSPSIDEGARTVSVSMGVLNASGVKPVEGATLFAYVFKPDGTVLKRCRMYTDGLGQAEVEYNWPACEGGCTVRLFFCCSDPVGLACVLEPCLRQTGDTVNVYTDLAACEGYGGEWPSNATVGGDYVQLYPTMEEVTIPPEPQEQGFIFTFTLCFPLLMIFGFLGAAMYASGRDPFAMFSFYTPRFTRGAERPIQGRGYTVPGSSIMNIAMKVTDVATGRMKAEDLFLAPMERSDIVKSEKVKTASGAVGELGEAAGGRGRGGAAGDRAAETRASERAALGGGSGAMPVGAGLGVSENIMRPGEAGMGAGTVMMMLLGIMLRFSNAPWLYQASKAVFEIAERWQEERVANYAENTSVRIVETMQLKFDGGQVSRITFTDPATGEVRTIEGREQCAAFINENLIRPMQVLLNTRKSGAAEDAARNLNNMLAMQNPTTGARAEMLAESQREGISPEMKAALETLADPNATPDKRQEAFEALSGMDLAGKEDLRITAFVAAIEGMGAAEFQAFVESNPAALQVMAALRGSSAEDFTGDGNMVAAIAMAESRLSSIASQIPEGQEDRLGLSGLADNLRGIVVECARDGNLGYRSGTAEEAGTMVAMGLARAANETTVNLGDYGIDPDNRQLSEATREELAVATDPETGQVDVSKLSDKAKEELVGMLQYEARDALTENREYTPSPELERAFYAGDSEEAKNLRNLQEALGEYGQLSGMAAYMMGGIAQPVMEEAVAMSGVQGVLGPHDELAGTERPYGFDSDKAVAHLRENGIDPGVARALSAYTEAQVESRYVETFLGVANMLASGAGGPTDYYAQLAGNAEQRIEAATQHLETLDTAIGILANPQASEASREWAMGLMFQHAMPMYTEARQMADDTNASETNRGVAQALSGTIEQVVIGAADEQALRVAFTEMARNPAEREAFKQILFDQVEREETAPAVQERARAEAAWDVFMVPAHATGERYAEAVRAQVPEADRARAEEAWQTLSTSTDAAVREQAGATLVELENAHPGFIASESFRLTGGEVIGAPAFRGDLVAEYARYAREQEAQVRPQIEGLIENRLALEEQQHQARQAQVAFLGNQAIDTFYANMGQNIRVAQDVEARIQEEVQRRDRTEATAESARADRDRAMGRTPRPPEGSDNG